MTTHEKAALIMLANEWVRKGKNSIDKAGEWSGQYMVGWHGGYGNAEIALAAELLKKIDVLEVNDNVTGNYDSDTAHNRIDDLESHR